MFFFSFLNILVLFNLSLFISYVWAYFIQKNMLEFLDLKFNTYMFCIKHLVL